MFRYPTVEALAAHLGEAEGSSGEAKRRDERADRQKDAAQRRRELRGALDRQ
jgi:predicted amidophosphoribosyltransferase